MIRVLIIHVLKKINMLPFSRMLLLCRIIIKYLIYINFNKISFFAQSIYRFDDSIKGIIVNNSTLKLKNGRTGKKIFLKNPVYSPKVLPNRT